jgi:hypothetical protein
MMSGTVAIADAGNALVRLTMRWNQGVLPLQFSIEL